MADKDDRAGSGVPLSKPRVALRLLVLSIGAVMVMTPVIWTLLTSLKTAEQTLSVPPVWFFEPQWSNFAEVLRLVPFQNYALNTAIVVTGVVVGTLLSCSFSAYGFARLRAPGKKVISAS